MRRRCPNRAELVQIGGSLVLASPRVALKKKDPSGALGDAGQSLRFFRRSNPFRMASTITSSRSNSGSIGFCDNGGLPEWDIIPVRSFS
jgi:hypothetical protein